MTSFSNSNTASVKDPLRRGTRTAWPFNFPCNSGNIIPIAFADPVVVGIKLCDPLLALLKSGLNESTIT